MIFTPYLPHFRISPQILLSFSGLYYFCRKGQNSGPVSLSSLDWLSRLFSYFFLLQFFPLVAQGSFCKSPLPQYLIPLWLVWAHPMTTEPQLLCPSKFLLAHIGTQFRVAFYHSKGSNTAKFDRIFTKCISFAQKLLCWSTKSLFLSIRDGLSRKTFPSFPLREEIRHLE